MGWRNENKEVNVVWQARLLKILQTKVMDAIQFVRAINYYIAECTTYRTVRRDEEQ